MSTEAECVCDGNGWEPCVSCGGAGAVWCEQDDMGGGHNGVCETCAGTGIWKCPGAAHKEW